MKPLYEQVLCSIDGVEAAYVDFNGFSPPAIRIRGRHPRMGQTELYLSSDQAAALAAVMQQVVTYARGIAAKKS